MTESGREWDDALVDVADELVKIHGPQGAIERLNRRRQSTRSDELEARCEAAMAWIKREVMDDT